MTWQQTDICWIESDHEFDSFGEVMPEVKNQSDELLAQAVVVWRKTSLSDFVTKLGKVVFGVEKFSKNQDVLSGAVLAFSIINFLPFHLKIVRDDEQALRFVNLLCEDEEGNQFLRFSDLDDYSDIIPLIDYFVEHKLFDKKDDRYIVLGRVLDSVKIL